MTTITLPLLGGDALPRLEDWAVRRANERSTWTGIAGWLVTIGCASSGHWLGAHADTITTLVGMLSTGLVVVSTKPRPPELLVVPAITPSAPAAAAADPANSAPVISQGEFLMSLVTSVRKLLGIVAVAVAPTWNKEIANTLAQAEATLVPLLGDDAKRLCEDAASTTASGFMKLANVVGDLAKIAADKGIKADEMILTVIAAKAYAQVKADAPALIDTAIETGLTVAAGPVVAAAAAPVVEAGVAAALPATAQAA